MGCCHARSPKLGEDFYTITLQFVELNKAGAFPPTLQRANVAVFDECPVDKISLRFFETIKHFVAPDSKSASFFRDYRPEDLNDIYCIEPQHLGIEKTMPNYTSKINEVYNLISMALDLYRKQIEE